MKVLLPILALLLLSAVTFADSTQQYNKLYLSPFYKDSLTNNVNSSFSVTVNPPDRIMDVKSAILYFNVYATGQTTNYSLWMNGQQCNTKNFYVSTTYATSGQVQLSFDCTNILQTSGDYSIVIRPSGSNTGAVTGWLEITYMNNPEVRLSVHGTEYQINDNATVFVQVPDFVNATLCTDKIYYPNASVFRSSGMNFVQSSSGLYYDNFMLSNITGVFMVESACYTPLLNLTVPTYFGEIAGFDSLVNSTTASTVDSIVVPAGTEVCFPNRFFEADNQFATTGKTVFLQDIINAKGYLYVPTATRAAQLKYNYYSFNDLTNIFTLVATATGNATAGTSPTLFTLNNVTGINITYPTTAEFVAGVCITNFGASQTFSFAYGAAANDSQFTRLYGAINISNVVTYKGGGEIHVSNLASNVWNYSNRTLTEYNNSAIYNEILNVNSTIYSIIVGVNSTLPTAIWNYSSRTLTDYNNTAIYNNILNTNSTLYAEILAINSTMPSAVWSYAPRTLTDYNFTGILNLLTGMSNLTAAQVWNYSSRNLTYYNLTETYNLLTGMSNLTAAQVWSFNNKTLNDYNTTELYNLLIGSSNLTAAQVWSYSVRTLTDYNNSGIVTDISLIPASTWNYSSRTLTDYNLSNVYALLADTNNTVYMNKASLATALVFLATINSTVFAIDSNTNSLPFQMSDLIATTHQTNSTVNAVLAFLQNATLNITVNATAIVNSTQIAEDLAGFDYYEYYVTPTGNVPIATGSLFGGIAYAAPNGYSSICLNQNTLQVTVVKVRCIDNNCKTIETNTTEQCNYGCDSTAYPPACSPSTSTAGMWFFIIIVILVIVMILLVRWATKRY